MSLFGQYIKERENKEIVENDYGFATYTFVNDGVYIEDIYVIPSHRKSSIASELADAVAKVAKDKGLTKLYGSVVPSTQNSTISLKVLLAYGFKVNSSERNVIFMVKDI